MLDSFPTGESCFVDANILGYASIEFIPLTARCRTFLQRVVAGEVFAFSSAGAVADALFKTMTIEAALRFVPPGANALAFLQSTPRSLGS